MIELAFALSTHWIEGDWNEKHPSIRYWLQEDYFVTAFHNSEDRLSLGVGYSWTPDDSPLFADVSLVSGYEYTPIIGRVGVQSDNLRVWVGPGVVGVELYYTFGGD